MSRRRSAAITVAALGTTAIVAATNLVLNAGSLSVYRDATSFATVDADSEAGWIAVCNQLFALLLVLRVVTAGALLTWLYGVHRNLPALGHARLDSKPIWAVICWFVSFMNLFAPYQVVHEIWWRSDPRGPPLGNRGRLSSLLVVWWGAWLTSIATSFWGNYQDANLHMVGDIVLSVWIDIGHLAAQVVAAISLLAIVIGIQSRQWLRHELLLSAASEFPSANTSV
ncbi:MAG: DUF4328 domain-containing protein [Pirellulaceae bacterium]|nr:DUF4328 domain-containing protein [Pirellulaceae bacterium]